MQRAALQRPSEDAWPTETVETIFGSVEAVQGDQITHKLQRFGAHQRCELAMLRSFLRPGDHVLDVGAHIGTFTLPLAQTVGPEGRVDAFEGLPQHVDILRRNVERRDWRHVHCHHALVGSGNGPRLVPWVRSGNSAETLFDVSEGALSNAPGPETWTLDGWRQAVPPEERPPAVAMLKIDVEGMEWDVLEGAEKILTEHRPMLYMEIHQRHLRRRGLGLGTLERLLRERGYHFFRNLGRRNGRHDRFVLGRHRRLRDGGPFFDVLAITPDSPRYPKRHVPPWLSRMAVAVRRTLGHGRRRVRQLLTAS